MKKYILAVVLLLGFLLQGFSQGKLVVIVNNSNPISNLSPLEVKNYYLRKTKSRWPGSNAPIYPMDFKNNPQVSKDFHSKILKMSREEVVTHFSQRRIANGERPPIKVYNIEQIIMGVSKYPGAIGFMYAKDLTDKSQVKVVCEVD